MNSVQDYIREVLITKYKTQKIAINAEVNNILKYSFRFFYLLLNERFCEQSEIDEQENQAIIQLSCWNSSRKAAVTTFPTRRRGFLRHKPAQS